MRNTCQEVLQFWFEETPPSLWFQQNDDFDESIRKGFTEIYSMARDGLCASWEEQAEGALALCLVLDQFPRNMFRNSAQAFATDSQALHVAHKAIQKGFDQILEPHKRRFLYLPYEHSENLAHQERCVSLFETIKAEDPVGYEYALRHHKVIERFGRFPHRNAVLGRTTTPEEAAYLQDHPSGF